MKLVIKLTLAIFVLAASTAVAFGDEPREKPGKPEKKQGYREVNGLKMYYEIHGTGKPLVVLHGAFGWATDYPALAKNRQMIAVEASAPAGRCSSSRIHGR